MEKIYRILLGIFLVCLIPILLVLSYCPVGILITERWITASEIS